MHLQPPRPPPTPPLTPPLGPEDHVAGAPDAIVELVAFGDYQCPHCQAAHPVTQELIKEFNAQLRFGWRHFPLSKIHPDARNAAMAAESCGDKFWQMHNLLFTHAGKLSRENLLQYVGQLEMDPQTIIAALDENRYGDLIRRHIASGLRSGVNTTPTFYINGRRHNGGFNKLALTAALQQAIAEKSTTSAVQNPRT